MVADAAKAAKTKEGLLNFYSKHAVEPEIAYVERAELFGRNAAINTETGKIQVGADPELSCCLPGFCLEWLCGQWCAA